jgi:Trypsin-like peptidase domain
MWPVSATMRGVPYLGHTRIRRNCSWPKPSIRLSRFLMLLRSSSSGRQTASSLFTGAAGGPQAASTGVPASSSLLKRFLERDENIKVMLPGGRAVAASLAGRDASTDVAVLRFQPDGLSAAATADSASLRPGHVVLALGNHHVVLRHVLRQLLNIDIEQVGKAPSAQVAVAYEVGGLFTAPAGVFELQAVHESTKPPMVLVLRADRRLGTLSGYRFFDTLQIGVDRR